MITAIARHDAEYALDPTSFEPRDYGLRVNQISVQGLFERYQQMHFLYPEKQRRLEPYWDIVQETWTRALSAGTELLRVYSVGNDDAGWSSITGWRSTLFGWQWQHHVSSGNPVNTGRCLMGVQAMAIEDPQVRHCVNFYQPTNRFSQKVYGSLSRSLATDHHQISPRHFFSILRRDPSTTLAERVSDNSPLELTEATIDFFRREAGDVFVESEELENDLELRAIDELYSEVGLRRYRRVFVERDASGQIVGAAVCLRGPLGLNFSFLENRCLLVFARGLIQSRRASVAQSLLAAAMTVYEDLELPYLVVGVQENTSGTMQELGGQFLRTYQRCTWLEDGFADWYDHVGRFFLRINRHYARKAKLNT